MAYVSKQDELWQAIDDVASSLGLTIYDLDRRGPSRLVIAVARKDEHLTDDGAKPQTELGQGGVTCGDCSNLVRELMVYFQAEGERLKVGTEPDLEVCSPGVNRQLRLPEHFVGAIGERVKIVPYTKEVAPGEKKTGAIIGKLLFCDGSIVRVQDSESKNNDEYEFLIHDLKKARVDFDFGDK